MSLLSGGETNEENEVLVLRLWFICFVVFELHATANSICEGRVSLLETEVDV